MAKPIEYTTWACWSPNGDRVLPKTLQIEKGKTPATIQTPEGWFYFDASGKYCMDEGDYHALRTELQK